MNSYANISNVNKKTTHKKKEYKFIIPLREKPIIDYYTKKNMMRWLYTINSDHFNIKILEHLFLLIENFMLEKGYTIKIDKKFVFCKFISWCFQYSSNYKLYRKSI